MPVGWDHDRVFRFLTKLSRSDPSSIDAFLETNREDGALGRYLIARQLKQQEIVDRLFPPHDAGWYRHLFDQLLVDGLPRFDRNALSIVTFNYDRSLEAYFHTRLQAGFELGEAEASGVLNQLPIMHVHGVLGEFPEHPYRTSTDSDELLAISRKIQIIHELHDPESDFCNDLFRHAHDKLVAAERIYFLGFGFHRDNLRRFQFFTPDNTAGKLLRATTWGYGSIDLAALRTSLLEMGFPADAFNGNGCNRFFNDVASLE